MRLNVKFQCGARIRDSSNWQHKSTGSNAQVSESKTRIAFTKLDFFVGPNAKTLNNFAVECIPNWAITKECRRKGKRMMRLADKLVSMNVCSLGSR